MHALRPDNPGVQYDELFHACKQNRTCCSSCTAWLSKPGAACGSTTPAAGVLFGVGPRHSREGEGAAPAALTSPRLGVIGMAETPPPKDSSFTARAACNVKMSSCVHVQLCASCKAVARRRPPYGAPERIAVQRGGGQANISTHAWDAPGEAAASSGAPVLACTTNNPKS